MRYQFTIAKDDGIRLIGIEDVDATQISIQCAEMAQVEIFLHSDATDDARFFDAEVIVLTLRCPFQVCIQSESMRQLNRVAPRAIEPRLVERDGLSCASSVILPFF